MTAPTVTTPERTPDPTLGSEVQSLTQRAALAIFIAVPFLALVFAVPVAWGGWLGWHDVIIALVMYAISGHGVTVGFHRHFTHKSFKPNRGTKIALAVAGSMAIEGPVIQWVADHRKHHKFSDRDGDPHSPWRYGNSVPALIKGLTYAHIGWLFDPEQTSPRRYAPDLLKDIQLRHERFRALLQINLTVLATAHAVAEGLVRGVSVELVRKSSPQVYTASGRNAAGPRAAPPMAVSRQL